MEVGFLRKLQREINFFLTLDERVFFSNDEVEKQPKQIPLHDYIAEVNNKTKNSLRG